MGNSDHGTTAVDFMAILQSIDYNKFKRFSIVVDEISAKLLSSFIECEVLVLISDRYGFEFSIKGAERKHRTEDSTHIQGIEIFDNRKFLKSFQSYLGNLNNRNNLVILLFQKWRETLSYVFNLLSNHLPIWPILMAQQIA